MNKNSGNMARNRKPGSIQLKSALKTETRISPSNTRTSLLNRMFRMLSVWKTIAGFVCFGVAVYVSTLGYLETRVNTPFDNEKVVQDFGLDVPERYWGSYRPGVYFGMKSREPYSPVFGLMWYDLAAVSHRGVRHWCDQNDNLPSYGWVRHDGLSFGEQVISDPPHTIVTSFVKTLGGNHGGAWTARINVTSKGNIPSNLMLIWYAALEESPAGEDAPYLRMVKDGMEGGIPSPDAPPREFKMTLEKYQGKLIHTAYSEAYAPGLHLLKEKLFSLLEVQKHPNFGRMAMVGPDEELEDKEKEINFIPYQMLVETPFVMDMVYTIDDLSTEPLKGDEYTRALEERKKSFDKDFESKFGLTDKGYSEQDVEVAKTALSSMLGGIGYFYGAGKVQSQHTREPVPYWKAPLYTGVPSRSFFPRGFLWDEGFHGLLISKWSVDIQMDIAAHWLDLVNVEGWIPREQILGAEALARVPKEFVVQSNSAANPPMLLIQLARVIRTSPHLFLTNSPHRNTLERMYKRLKAWYSWFQTTQKGEEYSSYRWRGREDDGLQLNPKTLTSGLDDYPRATHPSNIERHVDLRCWMFAAADSMAVIAKAIGKKPRAYEDTRDELGDEDLLNSLHWSDEKQMYADYGLHSDGVKLTKIKSKNPHEGHRVVRVVTTPPQPQLVTSAFGYVSLFPMLLKVLKPDSKNLGKILEELDNPNLLWSPYGLRSLSKSSPFFMKRNTEHDPPYWRGQVWININYLALAALKHYGNTAGPYTQRAKELHSKLRSNVVSLITTEYRRSGYLWEQYSGETGRGSGCRPFTGWSALLVAIMADHY